MKYEKNIHAGHRRRLFELNERVGTENLDKIQSLETILCYVFPRGDVNPLAHRLLDKYKNVNAIIRASVEDLMQVEGIGRNSAIKIRTLAGVCTFLNTEKTTIKKKVETYDDACDYVEALLRFCDNEEYHIIGLGANNEVLGNKKLAKGNVENVQVCFKDISLFVHSSNPYKVILVHNHPNGFCIPSQEDLDSHAKLEQIFNFSGCKLVDSLIVGADGIYSMNNRHMYRKFVREEEESSEEFIIETDDDLENKLREINDWK